MFVGTNWSIIDEIQSKKNPKSSASPSIFYSSKTLSIISGYKNLKMPSWVGWNSIVKQKTSQNRKPSKMKVCD